MEGQQQIVDYIRAQLNDGHAERTIRAHLVTHGWPTAAVDQAFEQYYQAAMPKPAPIAQAKRSYKPRIPKWTRARFIKIGVSFAVLAIVLAGAHMFWPQAALKPLPVRQLAYKQKQSTDVVILAGAISSFINDNDGHVPTHVEAASDGNLLMCGAVCTAAATEVSPLTVYHAPDVQFVPYTSGLQAPDKNTMYIVSGGICKSTTELGEQSVNPRAVVILYARVDDNQHLVQRCVTL